MLLWKNLKVKVVPSNIDWSDVGSFDSLYEELPKDENNNTINPNHISIDSKNNLIYGNERKIATVDIRRYYYSRYWRCTSYFKKRIFSKSKTSSTEIKKTTELT